MAVVRDTVGEKFWVKRKFSGYKLWSRGKYLSIFCVCDRDKYLPLKCTLLCSTCARP
jgi:hypothetical protein